MSLYSLCKQNSSLMKDSLKENREQNNLAESSFHSYIAPVHVADVLSETHSFYSQRVFYISDLHLDVKLMDRFKKKTSDETIRKYICSKAKEMISKDLANDMLRGDIPVFLFGGDISSVFEVTQIFLQEFTNIFRRYTGIRSRKESAQYLFAILGNHEFWEFENYKECYKSYSQLYKSLGFCFLNFSLQLCGRALLPCKRVPTGNGLLRNTETFARKEDPEEYDRQIKESRNILIVGGVGYAPYNEQFNADQGIYQYSMNRNEELNESRKWSFCYQQALEYARSTNCPLIVLTHNPLTDWMENNSGDSGCIYFNGHNHINDRYRDEEKEIHIYADNQIGYHNPRMTFKEAFVFRRRNPFAEYEDGCHEVTSEAYLQFYDYMNEKIAGNRFVERELEKENAKFYMIKRCGYYGFFLETPRGICICSGGRTKKIDSFLNIHDVEDQFLTMIQTYLKILSPYRYAQETIAEQIRSFGGTGKIHGCIIDIDFFNHVALNPEDGSTTYYHSPNFGEGIRYDTMYDLLECHNPVLAEQYRLRGEAQGNAMVELGAKSPSTDLEKIDTGSGFYTMSKQLSPLQRLFDKKILREWDERILQLGSSGNLIGLNTL